MDSFQEIFIYFRHNKLRTFITGFGVFWGIFMLVLLLGTGQGIQNSLSVDWWNDVPDSIWIVPGITSKSHKGFPAGRNISFTKKDISIISEKIKGVGYISTENGFQSETAVTYGPKFGNFGVFGVGDQYFKIKEKIEFSDGRKLNEFDQGDSRKVVVIGTKVSERFFSSYAEAIGKYININGVPFRVVGLFYDKGNQGRLSERVYIPSSTFKRAFKNDIKVGLIVVRPKAEVDGITLEKEIIDLLKLNHRISPNDSTAIHVNNRARDAKRMVDIFFNLNFFVWMVGVGTLLAGIVGTANVMIIIVKERTREIGIRKALGANSYEIISSIMVESILITSLAGCVGLVFGVFTLEGISALLTANDIDLPYFQNPEINLGSVINAFFLLVISGMVAGLIPAMNAVKIRPIEAMRCE